MSGNEAVSYMPINTPRQILFASMIGTTIEFFDFYIYATAAVLVFPKLFFPASDPASATLASLATFAIAFVARPIGSALFGHFGDRIGRKTTLVAALLTQLPQFERQVFCFQCGHVRVFTTSLQILCGQGFAGRGVAAGLPDGQWGG